jgi:phage tail sheath protein FI
MPDPVFGMSITQVDNEAKPAIYGDFSTIGLVVTAPDADITIFPENTPVLINSTDPLAQAQLGTTGSIAHQLDLINAQLLEFGGSASVVIVRVSTGADDAATMVNLIDGLQAMEEAPSILAVTPRLIGVPGYTFQQTAPQDANPVVASMSSTLNKLLAHAVITGPHSTLQAFTDWRETFSDKRLIPVETWVRVATEAGNVEVDSVGAVLGMMVARDGANGGLPFYSIANRTMKGIIGPNRPVDYSLTDGNVEGQLILGLNGGIIFASQLGDASSLGNGGFLFVGTDTASDEALWQFYNQTRGRDFIHLVMLRTLSEFLGRYNINAQTIENILTTMKYALRDLQAANAILGYQVEFVASQNSPEQLRQGRLKVNFKAEEPPVLRKLDLQSERYRPALDELLENVQTAA